MWPWQVFGYLKLIYERQGEIMSTLVEVTNELKSTNEQLKALKTQVTKIGVETGNLVTQAATLTQKIADLEAVIASGGNSTPELDAALADLKTTAGELTTGIQAVDDEVPDVQ